MIWAQVDALARMVAGEPLTAGQRQGLPPIQFLTKRDVTFDPTQGWKAYPDFADHFAQLLGGGAMRLASFHAADGVRPGVVVADQIVDLAAADPALHAPWAELLDRGPRCLQRVREIAESDAHRIALDGTRLAAPVQPRKFFAIGLNYADHVAESGQPMPEHLTRLHQGQQLRDRAV
jgi:hypothetical protein